MTEVIKNPLVSFCMTNYNQREYFKLALTAAFAQTYSPLEIVISDDHSTDGSDEMIKEMIEKYRSGGGVHTVLYYRNEKNLGNVRNFEKVYSLAHGELFINAHGDDISLPDRTAVIVSAWIKNGKKAPLIFHRFYPMSVDGVVQNYEWWNLTVRNPIGAAMAFSSVIKQERFPFVRELAAYDDNVFVRRAYVFGDPLYIDEKLIKYRVGSGNSSSGSYAQQRQKVSKGMIFAARQNLIDMDAIEGCVQTGRVAEIRELAQEIMDSYGVEFGCNPIRKFGCYFRACKRRGWRWYNPIHLSRDYFMCGYPGLLISRLLKFMAHFIRKQFARRPL